MSSKNLKAIGILLLIWLPLTSFCQDDAILKIGHKLTIHSKILNETRDAWVYLPPNYSDKYFQAGRYPVLYILDGDAHFHSITGMSQALSSRACFLFGFTAGIK